MESDVIYGNGVDDAFPIVHLGVFLNPLDITIVMNGIAIK